MVEEVVASQLHATACYGVSVAVVSFVQPVNDGDYDGRPAPEAQATHANLEPDGIRPGEGGWVSGGNQTTCKLIPGLSQAMQFFLKESTKKTLRLQ
uniref:Uncharacterized protein n=1 Tax=Oryza meridionalis TaxID=40149 RepID=A0A0E0D2H3_9ORYZ